jgi:hypothetical protein
MLVEVIERQTSEYVVDDSYLLTDRVATFADFRRKERDAYAGLTAEVQPFFEFQKKALKVFGQFRRGLLGPGDHVAIEGPLNVLYVFSTLEDAGKRTGEAWKNAYAFGPLLPEDAEDPRFNGEQGWPNRVTESRPIPYGVGHSPDGEQWENYRQNMAGL